MRFPWWLTIAFVCALFLATACGGDSGPKSSDSDAKTIRLVIMDQNVLHGLNGEDPAAGPFDAFPERIQLIAEALAKAKPDIVTLQEIKEPGDPTTGYPAGRQVVQDALGGAYTGVYGNFLAEAIDTPGVGQLTFSRLPIISSENHKVSAIRSVVRVTVQTDIGPVSIYNAHLEGTGAVLETGAPAELQEINAVIDFIQSTRQGGPAILAGDLNAQPDDPSIKRLVEAGFIDALATAGNATCAKAGDPGCTNSAIPLRDSTSNTADHRIDYIFLLPGEAAATVKDALLWDNKPVDVGGGHTLRPSDHLGVRAVIELEELHK